VQRFRRHGFLYLVVGAAAIGASIAIVFPAAAINAAQGAAPSATTTCTSNSACSTFNNHGKGPGVLSTSKKGNGLEGDTTFNSTSSATGVAGVIGQDLSSTSTFNFGVFGMASNGVGVKGLSNAGAGVLGNSNLATGVFGQTFNPSLTTGKVQYGVIGNDASTDGGSLNSGVGGFSINGDGVVGTSTNATGVFAQGNTALLAEPSATGTTLLLGLNAAFVPVAVLDTSGNLNITGILTTSGFCATGCAKLKSGAGKRVVSYVGSQSRPTMEDVGEAQLVRGQAFVRLDPSFANVIDTHSQYVVFLTPEGDTNGLYVAQRTPSGFAVREIHGGTASLGFAYRIVAKPFGDASPRLPFVVVQRHVR
ncbi:MAG TPA: hypothetical protein VID19_13135, partial [Candidatus Eremiobacteraceae bacterium]